MEYRKVDDYTIEKSEEVVETKVNQYDYDHLLAQKASIQKQKDADNAKRDAELAEVDALLAACNDLGITSKPS